MGMIMTALGPIPSEELGFTSMHEHVMCDLTSKWPQYAPKLPEKLRAMKDEPINMRAIGELKKNPMVLIDNLLLDETDVMEAEVAEYKAAGGNALLEMSVPGMRMRLPDLVEISRNTGVHVVIATGLYVEASWPDRYREMTVGQLRDHMVREIEEGIGDSGARAGHVKAAIEEYGEREECALRAAAQAAATTGLSLSIHPDLTFGSLCFHVVETVTREGLNPQGLVLSHTDFSFIEPNLTALCMQPTTWGLRLDYAKRVLDLGANVALDGFGKDEAYEVVGEVAQHDWQRIGGLLALLDLGYADQIVLGTDTAFKAALRAYGGNGIAHLPGAVVPRLRELGVTEHDIRQMTINNPARLLSREDG